jgi:hypothetical protein
VAAAADGGAGRGSDVPAGDAAVIPARGRRRLGTVEGRNEAPIPVSGSLLSPKSGRGCDKTLRSGGIGEPRLSVL